ncbi:polysaccharide biosynthesis protein [Aliterella atlantica]|uniref:Epimerase n=1 Tax=Aliterella atlantica CENA595 TaxID=1618023 RepID=A0A0D8ZSR8_9CYAN|nr:polysaccharide biosynthesis protein [Aliterella atlantica]KJH71549.1 epimerase [Aliterella atlantica CENA595]
MKTKIERSPFNNTSKAEIVKAIQDLVPPGSPEPQCPTVLADLQVLTADLIQAYIATGKLTEDPFGDVLTRSIHLYQAEVSSLVYDKVILVTGGEGCVGSQLVAKLATLGVKRIVSVDKQRGTDGSAIKLTTDKQVPAVMYAADVRDYNALKSIFELEKPSIVFHLAAQRLPWLAEIKIHETVSTSIFGIQNIIRLCESYGVQQCVFSSTGKASRYFTSEVYAASKKVAEWQFLQAALQGDTTYSMVRFTHMLDNSSVCQQIEDKIEQGKIVNLHAPERYIVGQNGREAVHLLLNALVLSQPGKLKFLTVRNLGWPTETLEIALYKILQSGQSIPIYFQGLIPGYEELFFLGQFDWYKPTEIHLLVNALEEKFTTVDPSGDILVTEIAPFNLELLNRHLLIFQELLNNSNLADIEIKHYLAIVVKDIVRSSFAWSSTYQLLNTLRWGVDKKRLQAEGTPIIAHKDVVQLLVQELYGRINCEDLTQSKITPQRFDSIIEMLVDLPSLEQQVTYLKAISKKFKNSLL